MATIQCFVCIQQKVSALEKTESKLKSIPEEIEKLSIKETAAKVEDSKVENLIRLPETCNIVCSGCKMQRYCSLNHRNKDRRQHREICQILTDLQEVSKVAHPLMVLYRESVSSIKQLQETIALLKFATSIKLKRPLTDREHELIGYPAYCQVCFGLENLRGCGECGGVAYCSEDHCISDINNHTPIVCRSLALLYSPYRQLANESGQIVDIKMDNLKLCLENSHLTEVFAKITGIMVDDSPWKTNREYQLFATCSSFSGIASICMTLNQVSLKEEKQAISTIYIVGANHKQVERYFQEMHFKFFFLMYNNLYHLELYMIGNQLKMKENKCSETISFDFQGHKRIVKKHYFPISFKQFASSHRVDPLLIIMFDIDLGNLYSIKKRIAGKMNKNDGPIADPDYETYNWRKCLTEILIIYGVPISFTSVSKALSTSNFAEILEVANENNIKVNRCNRGDINENLYREILPKRNQHPEEPETVIYANNYLEVIFTCLKQ